jgi:hypothetical protein
VTPIRSSLRVAALLIASALPLVVPSARAASIGAPRAAAAESDAPAVEAAALCPVCHVREGTTHREPVRATRAWRGVQLGFCSAACASEFDRNPTLYVTVADSLAAARDSISAPDVGAGIFRGAAPPGPSASTTPT